MRRTRATASAAPNARNDVSSTNLATPTASKVMGMLLGVRVLAFFCEADLTSQACDFGRRQDLRVHHSGQELFDRAGPEPVNHLPHAMRRHVLWRYRSLVDECLALDTVRDVSTHLKSPQQGTHAGVLQPMRRQQSFANLVRRRRSPGPELVEDGLLQFGQRT